MQIIGYVFIYLIICLFYILKMYVTVLCVHLLKAIQNQKGGKKEKDFHMLDLGIEYVSQPVREATQGQWDEN